MTNLDTLATTLTALSDGRTSGLMQRGDRLRVMLDVGGLGKAAGEAMAAKLRAASEEAGATTPTAPLTVLMTAERTTRKLIAVGSGKGGVGKSTLSANLAVALAALGRGTGLIDADIYGPSQAVLLANATKPTAHNNIMNPVMGVGGVPFLSMGQLIDPGQPIAWRGPMVSGALGQLMEAHWGPAQEIIVDLPPGTGDIQLSMVQKHRPTGAVIVSTPQDLALIDATRAIAFFEKAGVPIIGLVENMAGYLCPHCGEVSDPFGNGGAEAAARELGLPFLGRIPLDIAIRIASDAGTPPALDETPQGEAFRAIARKVATWIDAQ
jgi:ATP-binding protein involved in chromosome partitioning